MTILFITRKFPPATGGMENFSYNLYMALKDKADVELIKWGRSNKYLPIVLPWFFIKACWLLVRGDIDIVHVNDGVLAPLGWILGVLARRPYTIVAHGLDVTLENKAYQAINIGCMRRAKIVFCVSRATADEATKRGVHESIIHVIPNGVNDTLHAPRQEARLELRSSLGLERETPVLLTVGRLVERKGVAWFAENVMPQLIERWPKLVYAVVGDGENREKIERIIQRKKLTSHVRLLGRLPDEAMPTFYGGADVFVQPNVQVPGNMEGFGIVLLEAALCELPVVAAAIEGIKDAIVDGKNGFLVPEKDTEAFVTSISRFLKDPKAAHSFGAKSRQYTIKHYQWEEIAKRYIRYYETVLKAA